MSAAPSTFISTAGSIPILVIVIPLISAMIAPLIGRIHRSFGWYLATTATFIAFLLALSLLGTVLDSGTISYRLGSWAPPMGIEYVVSHFNGFVLVVISGISFIITLYGKKSVEAEIPECKIPFFYSVYLLFIAGILGIVITGDIFNLYVFIEITALSGYALVAMGKDRKALMASYNYLILGTIGATFIVLGIGYLYIATGTLNMNDLMHRLPELYSSTTVRTAFAFIMVGLCLKLALFPFHIWLPNVYTHSPSIVSALMAATSTKVMAFVLLRMMFTIFTPEFVLEVVPVTKILMVLSCVAIIMGSLMALGQTNIKRMLAYSSVGQIGYIILGASIATETAMTGSLIHVLNHALMKGMLFMVVGAVVYKTGIVNIKDMEGLGKRMPWTMAAFTVGAMSMIGFPFTVGFISKWYLATGAIEAGMWYLVPVLLVSSIMTAFYFWRVVESVYFKGRSDKIMALKSPLHSDEAPFGMVATTIFLAGLCVYFGLSASGPISVAKTAAAMLLGN
ncbi:NADH-ubiquinone oxidoreductase chain N [hydrothermal vent metagenome]|uniref:NADH-ubiquinone oxidoreductase chain N n=1 Tax=hydrothermal vent metagenome TaxID=652676 RepID=A0A3B0RLT6_9ZZZZ